ncbi:MAG: hypothetical protein MUO40_05210 [Anaerolineaceae bacterium]|nr:hypothetical protein [Anaerolineaceae bacterium]
MSLSSASTLVKSNKAKCFRKNFAPLVTRQNKRELRIRPINSVGQILSTIHNLPKTAVLLGKCSDGLPIFLDLVHTSIGSVLIMSDEGFGKTHQLQVIVESGLLQNAGMDLQVAVISKNPWEWGNLFMARPRELSLGCYAWHEGGTERLISNIFDICEERLNDSRSRNNILFVLDDLQKITNLDEDSRLVLEWLFDYGPKVNIWPIASISSGYIDAHQMLCNSFKTNVIGKLGTKKSFSKFDQTTIDTKYFDPGEFSVMIETNWMTYRLPMLGR